MVIISSTGDLGSSAPVDELLAGSVDGINKIFTTSKVFDPTDRFEVRMNGLVLREGALNDYVKDIGNQSITMSYTPISGDILTVVYIDNES